MEWLKALMGYNEPEFGERDNSKSFERLAAEKDKEQEIRDLVTATIREIEPVREKLLRSDFTWIGRPGRYREFPCTRVVEPILDGGMKWYKVTVEIDETFTEYFESELHASAWKEDEIQRGFRRNKSRRKAQKKMREIRRHYQEIVHEAENEVARKLFEQGYTPAQFDKAMHGYLWRHNMYLFTEKFTDGIRQMLRVLEDERIISLQAAKDSV